MQKLITVCLIIMLMVFVGISSVANARTGDTSQRSNSSTSKYRTTSRNSSSKPKNISATDSIFANIAKTNEAKKAWQDRNKKTDTPVLANIPAPDDKRQEQQLNAIQKQIADANRQQQIIAAAQTAIQIATTKRSAVTDAPLMLMPPVSNTAVIPSTPTNSGGTSWFMMFLVIGGIVLVIFWLKTRNSSNTIYKI